MSSHLLDDDSDILPRRDREVTLSTGSILALFFGLVLLCGLFFALGYNMHKPAQPPAGAQTEAPITDGNAAQFQHFSKPSAGSTSGSPAAAPVTNTATASVQGPPPLAHSVTATTAPATEPAPAAAAPVARPAPVSIPHSGAESPAMPVPSANGAFIVQVAAFSHPEDAEMVVSALRKKGYAVAAHTEAQDKLTHVQIGPLATKKDADTMKSRLQADGYNAIVK